MKMGWSEGEGLGKHRDGCIDHLTVQTKTDTTGLGATGKVDLAQETYFQLAAFDTVLRRLNEGKGDSASFPSEDQKNKKASKRTGKKHSSGGERTKKKTKKGEEERTKDGKKYIRESESAVTSVAVSSRLAHRKKFIANKRVDQYSREQLREILGTLPE